MSPLLGIWLTFPVELEIAVGVLLLAILGVAFRFARGEPNSRDPLVRARMALLADAPRWIGVVALLLSVFGFFLAFEPQLARAAVNPETDWVDWSESHARMSRLMAAGALVCGIGFLVSWALASWLARGARR